jgi:protein involved in polysaccharide export with SLBB domain
LAGGVNPTAYLNKVQVERVEAHQKFLVLDLDLGDGGQGRAEELAFPVQDRDLIKISPIATAGEYVTLQGYVTRPGKYQLTPDMRLSDLLIPYDNLLPEYYPHAAQIIHRLPPEYRPEIITVDLQQALEGNPEHNVILREYDEVRLFSLKEMEEVPEVVVTGAVLKPGTYRLFGHMTVKDLLTIAGNLKRGAFLEEAEITRYTPQARGTRVERFKLNLEKALAGHPQHNLPLQPEDHLVVRSIPDFGERMMVAVKGEVLYPGTYAIAQGETLSSVLERAGGFTDKAYLRGAVFSRESLKEVQREQLERLIAEEELQMARVAQDIAVGALSSEEAESAKTLLESRQVMVEQLKRTPVTGRLVVQLQEIEQLKESPQDIMLIGGDEIIVPENPQTVNVQGQVYNSASLSWTPGKTAGYYLYKVGGTKKDADNSQMFIVRADGTVVSRQQTGFGISWDSENWRWNLGGFNNIALYPGDSILVPEKIKKFDWLKEVKDLSTIIYQMALGAAAVASF